MPSRNDNGLASTLAAMDRVKQTAKEAAMQRLIKGAEDTADLQRQLVAVDDGDLRDSIAVTLPGQSTPAYSQPGGSTVAGENQVLVTAGNSDVRYPHHVEHGTIKAQAKPFFFVAYRLLADKTKRATASAFTRAAKKAWNQKS
ncbi:MAG: hypothetical protein MnENMB40S_22680 [Rhizobiaceae bacterium MnEN-MB40S]|nr:MAG: hypothetical protein MnENMB40S_22680 [Rhizobiaceae bacterium MnEN-MB40S]